MRLPSVPFSGWYGVRDTVYYHDSPHMHTALIWCDDSRTAMAEPADV